MSAPKQENFWFNIGCNVVVPSVLLIKGAAWFGWSAQAVLVAALAFPTVYFFHDLWRRKKCNWISVLGFVGVLLTGGVGLFALDKKWVVVKETSIPLLIGAFVLGSVWTKRPLARFFLYNDAVFDLAKIDAALAARNNTAAFQTLLRHGTLWLALSFLLSAALNCALALWIVQSPAGTEAFNAEIGRMMALSYPVITLPCFVIMVVALWRLIAGLTRLTGLSVEDCVRAKK